jgi:hypothetical protein
MVTSSPDGSCSTLLELVLQVGACVFRSQAIRYMAMAMHRNHGAVLKEMLLR